MILLSFCYSHKHSTTGVVERGKNENEKLHKAIGYYFGVAQGDEERKFFLSSYNFHFYLL